MKLPKQTYQIQNANKIRFSDFKGQGIILYFYPKDNTSGCTTEGLEFNALLSKFKKNNFLIFGISRDSIKSHAGFCDKHGFKFDLISDVDEVLCSHFGVIKEKNMYGKKVMGIERSTFVFDDEHKMILEYRKVKAQGHAEAVLKDILNTLK